MTGSAPGGASARRVRAVSLVPVLLAACSRAPAPTAELRVHVDEPVVLELVPHELPVVRATLDGRPGLEFLVDTGAEASVLFRQHADRLGLPILAHEVAGTMTGANGRVVPQTHWTYARRLDLGPARIEKLSFNLSDADVGQPTWTGILGQDLLARVTVVLDRQRSKLHLLPTGWQRTDVERYLGKAALGYRSWGVVETVFHPRPALPLTVGEQEYEMWIDTGATNTCFPKGALRRMGLEPTGTYTGCTVSGETAGQRFALEDFSLIGMVITGEFREGMDEHGLLGMDVLGRLVLVHDRPNGAIWLHNRTP